MWRACGFALAAIMLATISWELMQIEWARDLYCMGRIDAVTLGCF